MWAPSFGVRGKKSNAVGCGSSCVVCRASDVGSDEPVGHGWLLRRKVHESTQPRPETDCYAIYVGKRRGVKSRTGHEQAFSRASRCQGNPMY